MTDTPAPVTPPVYLHWSEHDGSATVKGWGGDNIYKCRECPDWQGDGIEAGERHSRLHGAAAPAATEVDMPTDTPERDFVAEATTPEEYRRGAGIDTPARETSIVDLAPGPLVEVIWSDSAGHSDWHSPEDARRSLDETVCVSAGYMAEDDERGILLVMGAGAMGSWLSSMAIPRHAVTQVSRL